MEKKNYKSEKFIAQLESSIFGPPRKPGVYAVCVKAHPRAAERVLYIGSSQDIFSRVMSLTHPYRVLFDRYDDYLVYTKCHETDDYLELEKKLIRAYKPLLNTQHKNTFSGKKIHRNREME